MLRDVVDISATCQCAVESVSAYCVTYLEGVVQCELREEIHIALW